MIDIIDTHVHIEEIEDLELVLNRAKEANVASLIAVGSDCSSNKEILRLSREVNLLKIYPALGIHPGNINLDEFETTLKSIEENISKVTAIGEIGLDYWYKSVKKNQAEREKQHKIFNLQLELAKKYSKPVIIHSRGAWEECYKIVKDKEIERAVFHWYSGPIDILNKIIEAGYLISATPALEYSPPHRAAIEQSPIENILVETDSPVRYKTGTDETYASEPKDVIKTLRALSAIKSIEFDGLVDITTQNAKQLFNIG